MAAPVSFHERSDSFPLQCGRRPYMAHTRSTQLALISSDRMLFVEALDQFYGGEPDSRTLELLRSTLPSR